LFKVRVIHIPVYSDFHSSPIPDIPLMCFALYLLFKGQRALHMAAHNNNVEVVKLLLLNGAEVNASDLYVSISVCYLNMIHFCFFTSNATHWGENI